MTLRRHCSTKRSGMLLLLKGCRAGANAAGSLPVLTQVQKAPPHDEMTARSRHRLSGDGGAVPGQDSMSWRSPAKKNYRRWLNQAALAAAASSMAAIKSPVADC